MNPAKCEWTWLDRSRADPCPLPAVQLVELEKVEILGVPLGSKDNTARYVRSKLLKSKEVLDRLAKFEDTQVAFHLLKSSFSIVKATHFMRTTPVDEWMEEAKEFDRTVRGTAERILGFPFHPKAYDQACLTTSMGGLGLRRCEEHALGAYAASFYTAKDYLDEK